MARDQEVFKFNLLPPKSKQEVVLEEERDDSLVYALLLLIFSLVVYGALVLTRLFVLQPRIEQADQAIALRNQQAATYQQVKTNYGELFVKGLTLSPLLDKDLDPAAIFTVADTINNIDPDLGITGYSREASGVFVFEMLTPSIDTVARLMDELPRVDNVSDVFLRSIEVGTDTGIVKITTELNINDG